MITVIGVGGLTQTVTVTQQGIPVILDVTPPNRIVSYIAGNTTFIVTSNTSWSVTPDQGWVTVTPSGTGNDTIHVDFTENLAVTGRIATIKVFAAGIDTVSVTVTQDGAPLLLNVTPPNRNVSNFAGFTNFSVISNTTWNVSGNPGWITVTPSGTGTDTIHVAFTENLTTTERIATLKVSAAGVDTVSVTVTQSGIPLVLEVTPPNQNVTASPGNTSFTVTSNTSWTATSDASWCTVTAAGSGNGTIVADFTENTAYLPRTANITINAATLPVQMVTVIQAKSTIGINEIQANELRIYPNPTKGNFKIVPANGDNSMLDVQVFDMDGRIVLKKMFSGGKEYDVNLSPATAGSYQVIIKTNNSLIIRKLVVLK
jgi:hypothetical protein